MLRALSLVLLFALAAGASRAEEAPPAAAAPEAAPQPAPVQPVPLPRVAEESEAVVRSARELGELSAPMPEIKSAKKALTATRKR